MPHSLEQQDWPNTRCTEAERQLINTVMDGTDENDAVSAVLAERLPADLKEQAIHARLDLIRAKRCDDAVWQKLSSLSYHGRMRISKLWDEIERIAIERLSEEAK